MEVPPWLECHFRHVIARVRILKVMLLRNMVVSTMAEAAGARDGLQLSSVSW